MLKIFISSIINQLGIDPDLKIDKEKSLRLASDDIKLTEVWSSI